jgi:hypothetical protein
MKLKTEHFVIGAAAVAGLATVVYFHSKHMHGFLGETGGKLPHRYSAQSGLQMGRLARRMGPGGSIQDSGITNVGQPDSGGVGWHAGGWGGHPHLDPGPWSYLTKRNENYTYSHPPTNRLLKPVGIANRKVRLQGATGLTRYLPGTTYTYW